MECVKSSNDFSTSPEKALSEIDPKWKTYPGLIIFGTHVPEKVDEKLEELRKAREKGIPTLGVCFGLQLMVIEYARNVLKLPDANSTELKRMCADPVIHKLPEMRVGIRRVRDTMESFWHSYAFNPAYFLQYEKDWEFTYDAENVVAEMRLKKHPHYVAIQYHAEYQSTREKPHPVLKKFIDVCRTAA